MILNPKHQRIGFTSDWHGFHRNIIKYSNRPCNNVAEMNETIRDRHNSIFDKDDIIFNLGDALLLPRKDVDLNDAQNWLKTFNGKIYYLPGNHELHLNLIQKCWNVLPQLYEIVIQDNTEKQFIVLCHYALRTWSRAHYGSFHLHGHSHGSLMTDTGVNMRDYQHSTSLDVGVDTNNFYPYTYDDVKQYMANKTFGKIDHH